MLLRMFSTDVAVREEHPSQALTKQLFAGVAVQESKKVAGKSVRLEQLYQEKAKLVPIEVSIKGKLVRPEHPSQAELKLVPLEVSINGKDVRLEQYLQANEKSVALDVLINGKFARDLH